MSMLVSSDRDAIFKLQALVDAALGYPCCGGESVGGGVHVDPNTVWTMTYADVIAHPDGTKWAYPVDDDNAKQVEAAAASLGMKYDPVKLGADWIPKTNFP